VQHAAPVPERLPQVARDDLHSLDAVVPGRRRRVAARAHDLGHRRPAQPPIAPILSRAAVEEEAATSKLFGGRAGCDGTRRWYGRAVQARESEVRTALDELREVVLNRRQLDAAAALHDAEDTAFVLARRSALETAESHLRDRIAALAAGPRG
jgi:hypothetical protein